MTNTEIRTPVSPFVPHTAEETRAMLDVIGVKTEAELFESLGNASSGQSLEIDARDEQTLRQELRQTLDRNEDLTEFLGRGHYAHYVPALVDHLSDRSEFLTSYTQYQPEVTQGFLQALFEYQSLLVELTGLPIANCSMYDSATALAEAARLAGRVRQISGTRILVPELLDASKEAVLENYLAGTDLTVEAYPMVDGNVDLDGLDTTLDEDVAMVYAESPTVRGTIERWLAAVGELATANDALFCLGSDIVALALLERPVDIDADVVVGDASALGLSTSYGMGLGLFACQEAFLRQVPGRLVGASEDRNATRAYTLTLQTREQHIRRERATSNICTNQAWLALRTAMHAAWLGPQGLVDVANDCVAGARDLAEALDDLDGVQAPVHDQHHFREFVARTNRSSQAVIEDLEARGFAIHGVDDHLVQICTTDTNESARKDLVTAFAEVA